MVTEFHQSMERAKKFLKKWYFLYQLNTCLSMCTLWEQIVMNLLMLLVLSILSYATYAYIPTHLGKVIKYLTPAGWLLNGNTNYAELRLN